MATVRSHLDVPGRRDRSAPSERGTDPTTLVLVVTAAFAAALGGLLLTVVPPSGGAFTGASILIWAAAAFALGAAVYAASRPSAGGAGAAPSDPKILVKAIETMHVGLTIADENKIILYANPAEAEMHGYSQAELIGHHVSVYSSGGARGEPEAQPSYEPLYGLWERDRFNVTRDGRLFPVRLTSDVVQDDRGRVIATITLCEDITERRAMEEALVESEAAYRTVIESASDLVVSLDRRGRIELANRSAIEALGFDSRSPLPRFEDVVARHHRERWRDAFRRSMVEGGTKIELCLRTRDGDEVPLEGRLDRRREAGGSGRVLAIFREVRERHAIDRLREEFVSVVNHELRTPITSVLGALSLLQEGDLCDRPERVRELLKIASRNGDRLLLLIDGLLDLQKMSAGLLKLERSPTPLAPLLEEVVEDMHGYAEGAHVRLELDLPPRAVTVLADRDRLLHALYNLISNAVKFSPDGETVSISARQGERSASITVRDRGPGIPPDFRDRLFDPFTQATGPAEGRRSGTGLGMTIAKRFVESLGGAIDARLCPGGGTAVTIEIPVAESSSYGS